MPCLARMNLLKTILTSYTFLTEREDKSTFKDVFESLPLLMIGEKPQLDSLLLLQ